METLVSLLKSCDCFQAVYSLQEYLTVVNSIKQLLDYPISPTFTGFLDNTLICLHKNYAFPTNFSVQARYSYCALIDNAISGLLSKKQNESCLKLDDSVQTSGYSYYKSSGSLRKNPMITLALKSMDWENLHNYVGSDWISHIIEGKDLSVFVKNGEAYTQVIGVNIARLLKPKIQQAKRDKNKLSMKAFKALRKSLCWKQKQDILSKLPHINRIKMLYNSLIRKKFSLPSRNLLNQPPSTAGLKISEKILGRRSKQKYLSTLASYFAKFSYNYQRINLGYHINKHCPLPKEFKQDFLSNISQDFNFEWLFANHCSLQHVCNFLITAVKKSIPPKLLGSKYNLKALEKGIISFLKLGVWEKVSCAAICSRFHLKDFSWIKETADTARKLLVGKIVTYIFNDFIIPLLQISFYITEKQHDTSTLFFYRKPLWSVIMHQAKSKLLNSSFFSKISDEEHKRWMEFTKFPPAKLRIQPKIQDFRPIMHFKSKIALSGNLRLSGNNLVAGVPQLLRNALSDPHKVMCLDYPSIISRLVDFRRLWEENGQPRLFFACMDIAKAFDSVKIETLIELLDELELPVTSAYYKFIQLQPRLTCKAQRSFPGVFKMKYKKLAVDEGEFPFFQDLYFRPSTLNVLTSRTSFITADKIRQVSRLLQGNVIKFNRGYFKGLHGVPQGLPCSPLLSNLYYSSVEEKLTPEICLKYKDSLLLVIRLHDDYLILTSNPEAVGDIMQRMEDLASGHGFHFAKNKICSNIPGPWLQKGEIEGWVGLDISSSLQVTPHVSENASKQISFDFITSKITISDLRNKLIKMTNLSINLIRFRSASEIEETSKALGKLMSLQASRFLLLLKVVRRVYGCRHSSGAISRIIVSVFKFSAKMIAIPKFLAISLGEFSSVFRSTEFNAIHCKLRKYLANLNSSLISI